MRNLVPLACLALVAAAGCAARPNTTEDLAGEVRAYSEGVRWRRYEDAAAKLPPALREAFLDAHDELDEDLFVDDYEIARLKLHRDRNSAIVQVKYTWHLDSVGVVHDTVVEQRWRRHGKASKTLATRWAGPGSVWHTSHCLRSETPPCPASAR